MSNPSSHQAKVVLLVDDNRTHQYSLGRHLSESGFGVAHAHTGAEALALARTGDPDVILMDINLPDMLGFDVCEALNSETQTQRIPVIFHSATHDTQDARSRAGDLGAVSFLSYPIDVNHLISVVQAAILRAQFSGQAESPA
jgi:CheY-like chemotaxis protein